MSVLLPSDRGLWWAPNECVCFACQCLVPEDAAGVLWSGQTEILFHPECARNVGAHLIADSREAELASGRQPWTRRAARALRTALVEQEVRP